MESIIHKVKQTIQKYKLVNPGDRILVALSGGPDSVALFHILNFLAFKYDIGLAAAHIDHNLRVSSALDRRFCRSLCQAYRVKFHSKKVSIKALAKRRHMGLEECGRAVRYEYYEQLCQKHGYDKIATGHTADDSAETLLLNLIRGAHLGGLAGISPARDNIIRPLIEISKKELVKFLKDNGLSYRIDRTNYENNSRRNIIRNKLLPLMKKINPSAARHIATSAEAIRQDFLFIQKITDEIFEECAVEKSADQIVLDLRKLSGYFGNLRSWVFLKAYLQLTGGYYRPNLESVSQALNLQRNGASVIIDERLIALRHQGRLILTRPTGQFVQTKIKIGQKVKLGKTGLAILAEVMGKAKLAEIVNNRNEKRAFLDAALATDLTVRNLKAGDRFNPLGMAGTKKVVDFLNDHGVPNKLKEAVPIVTVGDKIAWVAGYGIAEEFKVTRATKRVLKLSLENNE